MRMRLLPITIGVAALLLASKSLAVAFAFLPPGWTLHEAVLPIAVAASANEAKHGTATSEPPHATPPATPAASPKPLVPSDPPPQPVSSEERQLLQDLRDRRRTLDVRERVLTEREDILKAAEHRLVARGAELALLQSKLEQLEKGRADRDDANWVSLVKVYEAMKPREAAAIFNDMDAPILLELIDRMKETKAATILAAMQPDRARLATSQLAAKRSRTVTLEHTDHAAAEGTPHS